MPQRKEPCRNFLRGSCQYGDRCKFLHVAPQQSKPNPFGFGMPTLQQKPSPYGFGMQNLQPGRANEFGSKQNHFKAFENKWTRFSPIDNNSSSTESRRNDNQAPPPVHKCTDPESCKREIIEDFQNERPVWKLTCYGHCKNGRCDIVGDVSYEELRAAAYDDAKHGLSMQSIVDRERNLLRAKLSEFESLASSPYAARSNSAPSSQSSSTGCNSNASVTAQSSVPPLVSSFSQLGASVNTRSAISSAAAPDNLFGKSNPFRNLSSGPSSSNPFTQPNSAQNLGERSSFRLNNTTLEDSGPLASQIGTATPQSPFNSMLGSLNNATSSVERNAFFTSAIPSVVSSSDGYQSPNFSNWHVVTSNQVGHSPASIQLANGMERESGYGEDSIWMKKDWRRGEIPEEAPLDKYVF